MHYKSPNNNLRTFVEFLDQWIYALFCPAPPRTAPRIFTLAPPHPASSLFLNLNGANIVYLIGLILDCSGVLENTRAIAHSHLFSGN